MRKRSIVVLLLFVFLFQLQGWSSDYPPHIKQQLNYISTITNAKIKREIKTNILVGNFSSVSELQQRLISIVVQWKIEIERQVDVSQYAYEIYKLDKDRIDDVHINETKTNPKYLFDDITSPIPESYRWTAELAYKFDPRHNTNDHKKLAKDIDAYLKKIEKLPVIQYALKVTHTTIKDLKRNWFGRGRGFEHVFAGEIKGSKVSGYHWWYKFYLDERKGLAHYKKSLEGIGDQYIFTGQFDWDPDGNGPIPVKYKRKGGFITRASAPAILALGHIIMEMTRNFIETGKYMFHANINGETFLWKLYKDGNSLRTLYPIAN